MARTQPPSRPRDTDRPWLVALGGNKLNAGLELVARQRGVHLLVVDWNEAPAVRGDLHLRLDTKESARVLDALRPIVDNLLFVYTSSDVASETAAQIHAAYGLRRPPREPLATARNKAAMNTAWNDAGLLHKRFRACRDLDELTDFHRRHKGDSIVKPMAGSSSRGITVLHRDDEEALLAGAWQRASGIDPFHPVLVEEYVDGTEFTVEMLGDCAGNVQVFAISRKYHSANAGRSRIATKLHYNPPDLPKARQFKVAEFARGCFRALGLHTSLGHLELIMRRDGALVPLELGARSSGFIATHLVDAAAGVDGMFFDAYERVLRGELVPDETMLPRRSSMWFFYDFAHGTGSSSDTSLIDFVPPGITSLASDRSRLVRGRCFGPIDSDYERPGFEVLAGGPDALTIDAVERAESAHREKFLDGERLA